MKLKKIWLGLFILGCLGFGIQESNAQIVVRVKPIAPKVKVVKVKRPYKNAVWIDGYWAWNKRTKSYQWQSGRWVKTKRGMRYVAGHWSRKSNGWIYVPGKWVSSRRVRT